MDRRIKLTQGKYAIVDEDMYKWLSQYRWHLTTQGNRHYACGIVGGKKVYMHRLIMNAPKGMQVDHINHNTLDNRRFNLRICTCKQNIHNSLPRIGTSNYKGAHYINDRNRKKNWMVFLQHKYIGRYKTEIEAARAYDKAAKELYGEYAYLNFGDTGCPFCTELPGNSLCIDCRLEQAEHDVLKAMNIVEELKKEKEHELNSQTRAIH